MRNRTIVVLLAAFGSAATLFNVLQQAFGSQAYPPIHASGSWVNEGSNLGDWQANLAISGNSLTGTLTVQGVSAFSGGEVKGAVSGNSLWFTVTENAKLRGRSDGIITGTALFGSYEDVNGSKGTWSGTWMSDPAWVVDSGPSITNAGDLKNSPITGPILSGFLRAQRTSSTAKKPDESTEPQSLTIAANSLVNDPDDNGEPQNEPEIAVNPGNPAIIAAGANDYFYNPARGGCGFYFSANSGADWSMHGEVPGLSAYNHCGDPVLDFDTGSRLFYAGLASDGDICHPTENGKTRIFAARSLDGGFSYETAVAVASAAANSQEAYDKPWIAVDTLSGASHGRIYVTFTHFSNICNDSAIEMRVSQNASTLTFPTLTPVSDSTTIGTGSSVAIDDSGNPRIVWLNYSPVIGSPCCTPPTTCATFTPCIMYDGCTGGGTTCGTDRLVSFVSLLPDELTLTVDPITLMPTETLDVNSFPSLAIDSLSAGGNGLLFVVWADYRDGNANVYLSSATNAGSSWSAPKRITSTPEDEFFPTVTVDKNHFVHVLYYRRTSQTTNSFNVFEIFSNTGDVWSDPIQVNDGGPIVPTEAFANPKFIGDYIGTDSEQSNVRHHVWMDSRRLVPSMPTEHQQDIWTTTVSGC